MENTLSSNPPNNQGTFHAPQVIVTPLNAHPGLSLRVTWTAPSGTLAINRYEIGLFRKGPQEGNYTRIEDIKQIPANAALETVFTSAEFSTEVINALRYAVKVDTILSNGSLSFIIIDDIIKRFPE